MNKIQVNFDFKISYFYFSRVMPLHFGKNYGFIGFQMLLQVLVIASIQNFKTNLKWITYWSSLDSRFPFQRRHFSYRTAITTQVSFCHTLDTVMIPLRWSSSKIVSYDLAHHFKTTAEVSGWLKIFIRTTGWNEMKFESKSPWEASFQIMSVDQFTFQDGHYIVIL